MRDAQTHPPTPPHPSQDSPNEVSLSGLLEREHSGALETQVRLEVLGDLADEALERKLADEQLRGLLVAADLAERDGARAVAVGPVAVGALVGRAILDGR